jgi:hypothetical protein
MQKTSVYLPAKLKRALAKLARERGSSEAALLREAVERLTASDSAPAPRLPLFRSKGPSIAERVDEELAKGFGR